MKKLKPAIDEYYDTITAFRKLGYQRNDKICLCWLIEGKQPDRLHKCLDYTRLQGNKFLDHVCGFQSKIGEFVIVSQPYVDTVSDTFENLTRDAQAFANENKLDLKISRVDSEYAPGRTIKLEFRATKPIIIKDAKKRVEISIRLRYTVLERDNYTCRYCGARAPHVQLQIDHIISQASWRQRCGNLNGVNDLENLITSCVPCNLGKGARNSKI